MFDASVATITAWYLANCDTSAIPWVRVTCVIDYGSRDEIQKDLGAHLAEV